MVTAQFLGKIDQNSLLVQDDYIFVKVNATEGENERGVVLELFFFLLFRDSRDICVHGYTAVAVPHFPGYND